MKIIRSEDYARFQPSHARATYRQIWQGTIKMQTGTIDGYPVIAEYRMVGSESHLQTIYPDLDADKPQPFTAVAEVCFVSYFVDGAKILQDLKDDDAIPFHGRRILWRALEHLRLASREFWYFGPYPPAEWRRREFSHRLHSHSSCRSFDPAPPKLWEHETEEPIAAA